MPIARSLSHQERDFFFRSDGEDDGDKESSSESLPPMKSGSGDNAPRYPHVTGLPVITRPIFPLIPTSITLRDPQTIDAIENMKDNAYVGVFLKKKHSTGVSEAGVLVEKPELIKDASDLYNVGTFAQVHRITRLGLEPEDSLGEENDHSDLTGDTHVSASVLLLGHRRIDLRSVDNVGPPVDVTVSHWDRLEYTGSEDSIKALSNEVLSTVREVAQMNALFRESLSFYTRVDAANPYHLADFVASLTKSGTPEELQAVLEDKDPERRLQKALVLLNKEREVAKLQQEISAKVEEKMTDAQRKYFLNEQLKSIKKELGMERDDKETLIAKYREQLAEAGEIPTDVMETIDNELEKLSTLEKNSAEFNVTRSYLDWLCGVPWGKFLEEQFEIKEARKVLDRDHFGLFDVKDTILTFIAVGKLKGSVQGKILCLAGPPGTGKTSIAKSVAAALGRKFYRFSVGGLSDVSEIKGHRRTYIGAMPGKIVQCLKTTGSMNPLILIDEIDKLGAGYRGDPASALLEVLDPSQNSSFVDHFLDVPTDISKVLFMCTANDLSRIPGPLLDRMEVIELSGYDVPEKIAIAEQYLVPKSMGESGLMIKKGGEKTDEEKKDDEQLSTRSEDGPVETEKEVDEDEPGPPIESYVHAEGVPESANIEKGALESLVRWYCREAGVRNLAKHIDKITRKLALQVVAETEGTELTERSRRKADTWAVSEDNLSDYVGKPIFTSDRLYENDPLPNGIVMGLAWTSMGGSALYIETQGIKRSKDPEGKAKGGGSLKSTGQLGDVMKESTQIAYTVARSRLAEIDPSSSFFDDTDIHMHVPEGATPKDGPSAGVTMVTSMMSLATEKPVRSDVAMTGEISLTGKVLKVGGIKEKMMAARRAGITCVVLPADNRRDFDEIPEYLKDGLDVHFAEDYGEVYEVVFATP